MNNDKNIVVKTYKLNELISEEERKIMDLAKLEIPLPDCIMKIIRNQQDINEKKS